MTQSRTEFAATWPPTSEAAREAGHKPVSPLKAIRAKCLDCSCYQLNEIRLCEATGCALWPFRAGLSTPGSWKLRKPAATDAGFRQETAFQDEAPTAIPIPGRTPGNRDTARGLFPFGGTATENRRKEKA